MAKTLLNSCKGIKCSTKVKSDVNQIDCSIRNDFRIRSTVYDEFGSFIYGECKNEAKTPGNGYFYKLSGTISRGKARDERGFGIFFSRKKVANTWNILSREYFMRDNIIIISFSNEDFKLIKNGANFLTLCQQKIQIIKNSISTLDEFADLYTD
ncbi:hypothetical protein [Clostridium sp. LP20]|uniref:hypothetical protein n=1 Tax=Clostridium sp. LP20 TaxID=3418665 RepID=UPI003EE5E9EC